MRLLSLQPTSGFDFFLTGWAVAALLSAYQRTTSAFVPWFPKQEV